MTTPFKRVKANAQQQAQQYFNLAVDPADAEVWTPEYVATQSDTLGKIVTAAQQIIGNLTNVSLGGQLGLEKPPPVEPSITERSGITKVEEYQRPFWEVRKAMRDNLDPDVALKRGQTRLNQLVGIDAQMAKVRQAQVLLRAAGRKTYRRETTSNNPCDLCEMAATQVYYTDDLMPLHAGCACDIYPDDGEDEPTQEETDAFDELIAVHDHGEIGPMLTYRKDAFTGPQDLPDPAPKFVAPLDEPKQQQLALMQHQLGRAVEAGGSQEFREALTAEERAAAIEQAKAALPERVIPGQALQEVPKGFRERKLHVPQYVSMEHTDVPLPGPFPEYEYPGATAAQLHARYPKIKVSFDTGMTASSAHSVAQSVDDLMTKYPQARLREITSNKPMSMRNRLAETDVWQAGLGMGGDVTDTEMKLERSVYRKDAGLERDYNRAISAGYHPDKDGANAERAVVTHEFGHILDATGSYRASEEANAVLRQTFTRTVVQTNIEEADAARYKEWLRKSLSTYSFNELGYLNPSEALAEAFAHVELEPDTATEAEKALHKLVVDSSTMPQLKLGAPGWRTAATEVDKRESKRAAELRAWKAAKPSEDDVRVGAGGVFKAPHEFTREMLPEEGSRFIDDHHQQMIDNILARYQDCIDRPENNWIIKAGMEWYPKALEWMQELMAETGVPWTMEQAASAVAAFSENTAWGKNIMDASNFFREFKPGTLTANIKRALLVVNSDDPFETLNSFKFANFAHAILGDDPEACAIDRWATRVALGTDDSELAKKVLARDKEKIDGAYSKIKSAYIDAAKQLGIKPYELQAIVWVHAVPIDQATAAFKETEEWLWAEAEKSYTPDQLIRLHPGEYAGVSSGEIVLPKLDDAIYNRVKETGEGITVNLGGRMPQDGFAYAPHKGTEVKVPFEDWTEAHLDSFIEHNQKELEKAGNNIGIWIEDGYVYMDVSRVGAVNAKTIAAAQKADQLGVYDLRAGATLDVGRLDSATGKYEKIDAPANLLDQHRGKIGAADQGRDEGRAAEVLGGGGERARAATEAVDPLPGTDIPTDELLDLIGGNTFKEPMKPAAPEQKPEPIPGVPAGWERYYQDLKAASDRTKEPGTIMLPTDFVNHYREYDRALDDENTQVVRKAIQEDGIKNPIILEVTDNGGMVGEGNHRLTVAKDLGIKEVPVKIVYKDRITPNDVGSRGETPHLKNFDETVDAATRLAAPNWIVREPAVRVVTKPVGTELPIHELRPAPDVLSHSSTAVGTALPLTAADAFDKPWPNAKVEAPRYVGSGPLYHVSPTELKPGSVLVPSGGESAWSQTPNFYKGVENRRNWVWVDTEENYPQWAAQQFYDAPVYNPDAKLYVYEVQPQGDAFAYNGTGDEGFVANGATVKRLVHTYTNPKRGKEWNTVFPNFFGDE